MKPKSIKILAIILGLITGAIISITTNDTFGLIYGSIGVAALFYILVIAIFKLPAESSTNYWLMRLKLGKWVFAIIGVLYIIGFVRTITGI